MDNLNKQFSEAFAYSNSPKSKKDLESRVGAFVHLEGKMQGISAKKYVSSEKEYLSPQLKHKSKIKNIAVGALSLLLSAGLVGIVLSTELAGIYHFELKNNTLSDIINNACKECTAQKKEEVEFRISLGLKSRQEENNPLDSDWPKVTKVRFKGKKPNLNINDFNLAKETLNNALKKFCLNGVGKISNNKLICENIKCIDIHEQYRYDIYKPYKDRREYTIKRCGEYIIQDLFEELDIDEIKDIEIKKYGYPQYSNIPEETANFALKIRKIDRLKNKYYGEYEINASPLIDQKENKTAVITLFNSLTKILDLIKVRENSY